MMRRLHRGTLSSWAVFNSGLVRPATFQLSVGPRAIRAARVQKDKPEGSFLSLPVLMPSPALTEKGFDFARMEDFVVNETHVALSSDITRRIGPEIVFRKSDWHRESHYRSCVRRRRHLCSAYRASKTSNYISCMRNSKL
jgi:hypothetical protein